MKADQFVKELRDVLKHLQPDAWVDIQTQNSFQFITRRPFYCDRGNYLWHIDHADPVKLTIDEADKFPRYYFTLEAIVVEMQAWFEKRREEVVSVKSSGPTLGGEDLAEYVRQAL